MTDYSFLRLLRDATDLAHPLSKLESKSASLTQVQALLLTTSDLVHKVHTWQPEPSRVLEPFIDQVENVNEVWRHGLLCYIYAGLLGLPAGHEKIQSSVRAALPAIYSLTWINQIQWPFYMVAVHILEREDQVRLRNILRDFGSEYGFRTSISAQGIMDKVWEGLRREASGLERFREITHVSKVELNITL